MVRLWVLGILLAGALAANAHAGPRAAAGPYRVEVTTDPAVIPVGRARLLLRLTDAAGKPVSGAQVRTLAKMPGMEMGEREESALPQPGQQGIYVAPAQFAMAGGYTVTLRITGPQGPATATVPLQTGQDTGANGGRLGAVAMLPWLIGLLGAAFLLYRVWRTGQRPNWRAVFNRQVLGGLLLLALMLTGSIYAVRSLRRQGAMTPIEAQAMEMATPPPPGTAPVALATAHRGAVTSTIRYTGQAVAYVEQDLYPRVTGWITWMPFYAGDRVRRGQVLARLDTSQVRPQVGERRAAVAMAEQGAAVARFEYQQAQAAVHEAHAEAGMRRGALSGAQRELDAAREERVTADADLAAAETQVADADAQVRAAQAEREYVVAELRRSGNLLKEGAVSEEEHQRVTAQAEGAESKVRQAQARTRQVEAEVRAARARLRKADAMIAAAEAKVEQTTSELAAHRAHVRASEAAARAARQRIAQAQAGVAQARAALTAAATTRGYTEIRSQVDGVVTQRVISPGVLVNPGQLILKIAQIQPIRLQANVAEADLPRVRVGARVTVRRQGETGGVAARVTSVAPAVDPVARTGLVEAVVPNRDLRFLPGQYATMEIATGERRDALRVPARAIRWRTPPSGDIISTESTPTVFVAEPATGREGEYTVREAPVRVGLRGGDTFEIVSGLKEGEQIVVAGHEYLRNGDAVRAVEAMTAESPGASSPPSHPFPAKSQEGVPAEGGSSRSRSVATYTCPMHPEVVQNGPGKCPKCGMDLVPRKKESGRE
jgi:RND family efflux transporter MFP subunit